MGAALLDDASIIFVNTDSAKNRHLLRKKYLSKSSTIDNLNFLNRKKKIRKKYDGHSYMSSLRSFRFRELSCCEALEELPEMSLDDVDCIVDANAAYFADYKYQLFS